MNRHSLIALLGGLLSCSTAAASDFSCLQALIPATDHYWVRTHRKQFALPEVNASQSAIAIGEWDNDKLVNVYVYTKETSRRFDRVQVIGADRPQELKALAADWLKAHVVATKVDNLEVFQFPVEPPGGWDRQTVRLRATASEPELGGWLVEAEKSQNLKIAIQQEIQLRQDWVRHNNLDATRFKAWSKAEKVCRH
jgi:hypothetical protein